MEINDEQRFSLGIHACKVFENFKGILDVDDICTHLEKRFGLNSILNTLENRKKLKELIFKTSGIWKSISVVILDEESFDFCEEDGFENIIDTLTKQNISVGVRLDKGTAEFGDDERVSVGLEDLSLRCKKTIFSKLQFSKWRSIFRIGENSPTKMCIEENCAILAEYAEISQKNNMVPVILVEILLEGNYSLKKAKCVQKYILSTLIHYLNVRNVYMHGMIIETNFVTPGNLSETKAIPKEISYSTFDNLMSTIPCSVPGIVFLSGGHSIEETILYLKKIGQEIGYRTWKLSFMLGDILAESFISNWLGKDINVKKAQEVFLEKLQGCSNALKH